MEPLNRGWDEVRTKGISKLENFLTRGDDINFTKKEYMTLYTTVYNLSTMQVEAYTAELYKRYTESIQKYLSEQVVPLLLNCEGSILLKELEVRWRNHQIMVRWLKAFFQYLDRYHVEMHNISNLND
jgi:cullin 1